MTKYFSSLHAHLWPMAHFLPDTKNFFLPLPKTGPFWKLCLTNSPIKNYAVSYCRLPNSPLHLTYVFVWLMWIVAIIALPDFGDKVFSSRGHICRYGIYLRIIPFAFSATCTCILPMILSPLFFRRTIRHSPPTQKDNAHMLLLLPSQYCWRATHTAKQSLFRHPSWTTTFCNSFCSIANAPSMVCECLCHSLAIPYKCM